MMKDDSVEERRFKDLVKRVSPPELSQNDWLRLENRVFAELETGKHSRLSLRERPAFSFFFKPVVAAALLLAIGAAVFLFAFRTSGITREGIAAQHKAPDAVSPLIREFDLGTQVVLSSDAVFKTEVNTPDRIELRLEKGSAQFKVSPRQKGQTFIVNTPNAFCSVVGTEFQVEVSTLAAGLGSAATRLFVSEGKVRFAAKDLPQTAWLVKAGESAERIGTHALAKLSPKLPKAINLFKGLIEQELSAGKAGVTSSKDASADFQMYQLALQKMDAGSPDEALSLLSDLLLRSQTSTELRQKAFEKKAGCCRMLGDYAGCVSALSALYESSPSPIKRDNLLWEIASIKATQLGLFEEAAGDLRSYVQTFPHGVWIQEAYLKLAETQYLMKQPDSAVTVYARFAALYPESPSLDKALYHIAYIQGHDLKNCAEANKSYDRLERNFPSSSYLQDAVFWHADCLMQMGETRKAQEKYEYYLKRYPSGRWKEAAQERLVIK